MSLRAGLVLLWLAGPLAAQSVEGSLPEARALAVQAVLSGDAAGAREIAAALLTGNPDDRAALIVLAAAEPALGRPAAGRLAAARAWRLSATDADRYEAARLAALAAQREGRSFLSLWWLRRALDAAPSEAERERTQADARLVRARSPWRADVELSFAPSDNVNGGSESELSEIDGLPFLGTISADGRALSGFAATLDATLARRLQEDEGSRTEASVRLWGRAVTLSDEARELLASDRTPGLEETVTGTDFSSAGLELGLGHDRALGWGVAGLDAVAGTVWVGDDDDFAYDFLRLEGSLLVPVGERTALRVQAFAEERDGGLVERRRGVSAAWTTQTDVGPMTFSLGRTATGGENGQTRGDAWSAAVRLGLARPVGPARLAVTVTGRWAEFPDYQVLFPVPGGRQDDEARVTLEAAFPGLSRRGFVPVVTLDATRTTSNVSRFDGDGVGLSFALRSSF